MLFSQMTAMLAVSFIGVSAVASAKAYEVDTKQSHVQWTGKKKLIDSAHTGKLKFKNGSVIFSEKGDPQKATLSVDMASISNEDLTDAKYNAKLIGHLKSDDFFSVDKHPLSQLTVEKFQAGKNGQYTGEGKLTIKGIVKAVKFSGKLAKGKDGVQTADVDLVFDRTDFDVRYGSGKFFQNLGDKMIADEVTLKVHLSLKPQQGGAPGKS